MSYPNTWNVVESAGVICEPERPPLCLNPDFTTGWTQVQFLAGGVVFTLALLALGHVVERYKLIDFPGPIRALFRLIALSPLQDVVTCGIAFLSAVLFWYSYANNRLDFLSVYLDFFVAAFALLQDILRLSIRGRLELFNLTLPRLIFNLFHASFEAEYALRGLLGVGIIEPRFWHVGFFGWGHMALVLREYLYMKSLRKGNSGEYPANILINEVIMLILWACFAGQLFALVELMASASDDGPIGLLTSAYVVAMAMLRVGTSNVALTQSGKLILTVLAISSTYSLAKLFTVLFTETVSRRKFDIRPLPPFRQSNRPLLLVTGYPEPETVAEFLLMLFKNSVKKDTESWDVLVLVPTEALFFHKVRDLVKTSPNGSKILSKSFFQHGSPVVDAGSLMYECVVILPSFTNDHDQDDAHIAVLALALQDKTKRLVVAGKGQDERVLQIAGNKKNVNTVVVAWPTFRYNAVALGPSGASAFVGNLLEGELPADNQYAGRHGWSFEYENGMQNRIKLVFLPGAIYGGRFFQEVALDFLDRSKGKAVLLAFVDRSDGERKIVEGNVLVNPRRNVSVHPEKGVLAVFLASKEYEITIRRDGVWSTSLQTERGPNADEILDAEDEDLPIDHCLPEFVRDDVEDKKRTREEMENEAENVVWKKALQEGRIIGARKVLLTGRVGIDVLANATGISKDRLGSAAAISADELSSDSDDDSDDAKVERVEEESDMYRERRKAVKRDVFEAFSSLRPVSDEVPMPAGEDFPPYVVICSVSKRAIEYKALALLARRLDCNVILMNKEGILFVPSDRPAENEKRIWHIRGHPSNERDLKQLGLVRAKAIYVLGDPGVAYSDAAVVVSTRLIEQRIWKLSAEANPPIISELAYDSASHLLLPMRPRVGEPGLPFFEAIAAPDGLDLTQSGRWASGQLLTTKRTFLSAIAQSVLEPATLPVVNALMRSPVRLMLVPDRWFGKTLGRYMRWLLVHRRLVAVALVRLASYALEPEAHLREFALKTVTGNTPVRHRVVVNNPSWELALQPGDYFICYREAFDPKKFLEHTISQRTPAPANKGRRAAVLAV